MSGKSGIDMPGAVHPVIERGIEGGQIFRDDKERVTPLNVLKISLRKSRHQY
ncbi:MAG: hypothetical protein GX846_04075 [Deltaproteobacteria bacterium]|nr:hypothetical protein [Deltaproteobacteria bacterium]